MFYNIFELVGAFNKEKALVEALSEHCEASRWFESLLGWAGHNLGHGSWRAANHPPHLPEAAHDCPNNSNDKMGGSGRLML